MIRLVTIRVRYGIFPDNSGSGIDEIFLLFGVPPTHNAVTSLGGEKPALCQARPRAEVHVLGLFCSCACDHRSVYRVPTLGGGSWALTTVVESAEDLWQFYQTGNAICQDCHDKRPLLDMLTELWDAGGDWLLLEAPAEPKKCVTTRRNSHEP